MSQKINLHLISDSTGETLSSVARAVLSQFDNIETNDFIWSLVRTDNHLKKVMDGVSKNPGIVLYTIVRNDLTEIIKKKCIELKIPCISVLSHIISEFSNYLQMDVSSTIGRQHLLNNDYFMRVEAINYTINHDDGQGAWDLYDADIVIIGVSRTSKSPTCVYLSCRGYKAANIPFVKMELIPDSVFNLKKPLIIGLTIDPAKLIQIRHSRLKYLKQDIEGDYVDLESIKNELIQSRKLFSKLSCPVIDVTKSSVEETAAKIMQLVQTKNKNQQ
jgi:regulator of PEP synthase PpsR (kinase-PPPase family)